MQQGYFDQCNDIISELEDKLSKIQLIVDDLSVFAFGNTQIKAVGVSDAKQLTGTPVPSSKLQNRMIDAGEHADLIIDELTRLTLFLLGKQEEGWKDDLAFTDSAEAQEESKGEPPSGAYVFSLMKFDPVTGEKDPIPNEAKHYRNFHGDVAWIYNPYSGEKRDPRDIGTDVFGFGIITGANNKASPVKQAKPETLEAVEAARKIVSERDYKAFTKGEACYVIDITSNDPVLSKVWDNNDLFKELLVRGLVFKAKEKEAAIAHAKALIAVSKGE